MILTLLPNPALDKTVVIPGFAPGAAHRPGDVMTLAGGKGLNFARALGTLGVDALVVTTLGGNEGQRLQALAKEEGLALEGVPVAGALRTCLSILDPEHGHQLTEIYERGSALTADEWERLVASATRHVAAARFLAVCGSLPPGVPEHGLRDVLDVATARGLPVLLDTMGTQTLDALTREPALLKVNGDEAATLTGMAVTSPGDALVAARALQEHGAHEVVITLGAWARSA
jgi:1-phosphofructokinase family hexose kinase